MTINFLQKGDLVDVISPSSPATKSDYKAIVELLEKNGLRARFHFAEKLLLSKKPENNFAQSLAKIRFDQLQFALENKDSRAVWCVRGGYGALDLVPFFRNLKKAPNKMFIGFSDITTLGIFLDQKLNLPLVYGPMLNQIAGNRVTKNSQKNMLDFVFGKKNILEYKLKILKKSANKKISAPLIGGCLSVIMSNFGTTNQIDFAGKILLLEDISESGEKLDRYFEQLLQIMILSKKFPKAILLGNYKEEVVKAVEKRNINIAIERFAKKISDYKLDFALFRENSQTLGHAKDMRPIVLNWKTEIDGEKLLQKF